MSRSLAILALCCALAGGAVSAQVQSVSVPDFSGRWTTDVDKTKAAFPAPAQSTTPGPSLPGAVAVKPGTGKIDPAPTPPFSVVETFVLRQTDTTLTRESDGPRGVQSVTYTFGTTKPVDPTGQVAGNHVVDVRWVNESLVISTTQDNGKDRTTSTTTYSFDGPSLVVTTTQAARPATAASKAFAPRTRTIYYKQVVH